MTLILNGDEWNVSLWINWGGSVGVASLLWTFMMLISRILLQLQNIYLEFHMEFSLGFNNFFVIWYWIDSVHICEKFSFQFHYLINDKSAEHKSDLKFKLNSKSDKTIF